MNMKEMYFFLSYLKSIMQLVIYVYRILQAFHERLTYLFKRNVQRQVGVVREPGIVQECRGQYLVLTNYFRSRGMHRPKLVSDLLDTNHYLQHCINAIRNRLQWLCMQAYSQSFISHTLLTRVTHFIYIDCTQRRTSIYCTEQY